MRAEDDTGGEERKDDDRRGRTDVARIEARLLDAVEVRHHAERGDAFDEPRLGPLDEQVSQGGQPARMRKSASTTETMKATT
jgi:hypothetical protein